MLDLAVTVHLLMLMFGCDADPILNLEAVIKLNVLGPKPNTLYSHVERRRLRL